MASFAFAANNVLYPKKDTAQKALTESYTQAVADLQTIQAYNKPNATQIEWALKRLAEIQEKQLKVYDSGIKKLKADKTK